MSTLADRVAIVTGAGHGIGHATALALAGAGAAVAAVDIDKAAAEKTAAAVAALGRPSLALAADVGDLASIDQMVGRVVETFGRIDTLVNNAGVTRRAYIMDLTEADWDRIMRVNGKGVFFCLQRVAREMIPRRSGAIVNIASIAGKGYAGASNAIYAGSKGAVIGMTRLAALQLARHNINVNAICPGTTVTALSNDNLKSRAREEGVSVEEMERRRNAAIPLGRANDPEDIAALAVFLASPGARNITGQSLNVDGGIIFD
jgi:NAD(P)-dependent dehydrogenase (short-subunit alcohol dehydrogenase family)